MARSTVNAVGGVVFPEEKKAINDFISNTTQELVASGAVVAGVRCVELNHSSVAIAATIADAADHAGFFAVKDMATGATHTLTLASGTFDGTNEIATLNAANELLLVFFDDSGNGTIILNTGSVALSTAG